MPRPRARLWLASVVLGALVALIAGALFTRSSPRGRGAQRSPDAGSTLPTSIDSRPPMLVAADVAAWGDGPPADASRPALDCAHPAGNAALIDDAALTAERVCARLARMGGLAAVGADRRQARVVLDQLIDVMLVGRALAWERAAVTDDEVSAALAELRPARIVDASVDRVPPVVAPVDPLVREQVRERLELRKLAALRHRLEVSDAEVDAEVAAGAPGIDRGQGIRVEAWLARMAPGSDGGARPPAQAAAEAFATAVQSERPEAAASRLAMSHLAPFVLGANGVEPDMERAALGLSEGQWSGAIHTRVGWAVLRALGRVEGTEPTPDALRALVRRALESRKLQAARQELLAALRSAARIEVLVDL
ncbi:MAG: peptidylprolyl isomerase [Deltaproteobacteria bacterium]|nr:peptidylprolyl isomerase [Deltaproteobacteria bacterium]MBK8697376.1 peptidylprolyl isomerase [Deltaproteobacteria bacterium]